MENDSTYTAFAGHRRIASGGLRDVVLAVKAQHDKGTTEQILLLEDRTGAQVDLDLRGTPEEALARLGSHPYLAPQVAVEEKRTGPGRPRLGVVSREVSLLPRHWEWLAEQPGGASAALRSLVEAARKDGRLRDAARQARDAAGKVMWVIAGDLPGFEEASRALWAKDAGRFAEQIRDWPEDVRDHLARLVAEASRLEAEAAAQQPGERESP